MYDWQLLLHSRDIVFPVFARTVEYAGRALRTYIIEELALPPPDRFTYFRLGHYYLQQMWLQHGQRDFDLCLAPEDAPVIQPRLTTTFREVLAQHQRGIEPYVWEHLLNNTK